MPARASRPPTAQASNSLSNLQDQSQGANAAQAPSTPSGSPWDRKIFEVIPGQLSFTCHSSTAITYEEIAARPKKFFFSSDYEQRYAPFHLDFGPVNLAVVHKFCAFFGEFWTHPKLARRELIYYTDDQFETRTNCAFLIASFMVLHLGYTPKDAWAPFTRMPAGMFRAFRDVTESKQDYELTVLSCLQGLHRAAALGWYKPEAFSAEAYLALEADIDLSVVSPKFVAFKGPEGDGDVDEHAEHIHALPPKYYTEAFRELNVRAVVRLNDPSTYAKEAFTQEGFAHHDMQFADCTFPDRATVEHFLETVDAVEGMVAVHCAAGLGRTGTMIAIHMMKNNGFSAAEAIGWLRIARPGSVIGPQQRFLHWVQAYLRGRAPGDLPGWTSDGPTHISALCGRTWDCKTMGQHVKRAQIEKARRQRDMLSLGGSETSELVGALKGEVRPAHEHRRQRRMRSEAVIAAGNNGPLRLEHRSSSTGAYVSYLYKGLVSSWREKDGVKAKDGAAGSAGDAAEEAQPAVVAREVTDIVERAVLGVPNVCASG